jgi:phosphoheptose isomerase
MNIIVRMLLYLAETYSNYYKETKQSLYSSKKVTFPKPELYVIYTGEKGSKKDVITLSEEFLGGESCALDINVKVLYYNECAGIANQYIKFTKIYNEQLKLHGRTGKTVLETIRICKDGNVLKEYLEKREREVVTIMMTLFDTEYIFKTYVESEKTEAERRGEIRGEIIGERKGEIKGERKGELKGAINATIRMCKEFNVSVADTVKKIIDEFGLTENEAERKVKEYWK